MALISWVN